MSERMPDFARRRAEAMELADAAMEFAGRNPLEALRMVSDEVDHRQAVEPAADFATPVLGAQVALSVRGRPEWPTPRPEQARQVRERRCSGGLRGSGKPSRILATSPSRTAR